MEAEHRTHQPNLVNLASIFSYELFSQRPLPPFHGLFWQEHLVIENLLDTDIYKKEGKGGEVRSRKEEDRSCAFVADH